MKCSNYRLSRAGLGIWHSGHFPGWQTHNETNWRSTAHQSNFSTWPALPYLCCELIHLGAAEKHHSILGTLKVEKNKGQGWMNNSEKKNSTSQFFYIKVANLSFELFSQNYTCQALFFVTFSGSVQYERHTSLNVQYEWMWKASVYISHPLIYVWWRVTAPPLLTGSVCFMSCILDQLRVLICIV